MHSEQPATATEMKERKRVLLANQLRERTVQDNERHLGQGGPLEAHKD